MQTVREKTKKTQVSVISMDVPLNTELENN